jgi:hypothetical protein
MSPFGPPSPSRADNPRRHPTRVPRRRTAAAVATLAAMAFAVSACGSADSGTSTPTHEDHDTAALAAGATWLQTQVVDGAVHNDQYDFDDYGLAVDIALALDGVHQQPDTVAAVSDNLAHHLDAYIAPGFGTLTSAGSTAKALVLAEATGADPTTFGGTDLVGRLEGTVADDAPVRGRIQDELDPKEKSAADYANVVGQAYAVTGLVAADSDEADAATRFLLAQQCKDGFFRLNFTKDAGAADQTCDGDPSSAPDLDATAFAVRALSTVKDDPEAAAHVKSAVTWLQGQQAADGSFGGGTGTEAPNSNSTGLAGWVLGETGDTAAAEKAATWVHEHQAAEGGACRPHDPADVGAIAYDDAALAGVRKAAISAKTADQFRRATAQALPALRWLPAASASSTGAQGSC